MKKTIITFLCLGLIITSCKRHTFFEKKIVNHSNKDLWIIMRNSEFGSLDSVFVRKESDTTVYIEDSWFSKVEEYELCNYTKYTHSIDTIKVVSDNYYVDYYLRFNPKDSTRWEFETKSKNIITGKGDCNCELTIWNIDIKS